jgi:hypothetical protein
MNPTAPMSARDRERAERTVGWVIVALFVFWGVAFSGLGVYVIAASEDDQGFLVVFVLCVDALFFGGALAIRRQLRPTAVAGVRVTAAPALARRGGIVTVRAESMRDQLEVGVVCVECQVSQQTLFGPDGDAVDLGVEERAIAYEAWRPVERPAHGGERAQDFIVPRDAPFSYEGENVRFEWYAAARSRDGRGLKAKTPVWILP